VLLDVAGFLVQVVLFFFLSRQFAQLAHTSMSNNAIAKSGVILFCFALVLLSPIAAILKRHSTRRRNPEFDTQLLEVPSELKRFALAGYLISQFLFWLAGFNLLIEWAQQRFGEDRVPSFFMPLFFGVPLLALLNTAIFLFYFRTPKRPPLLNFLASPLAESLGDLCLFLNMVLFQMFWGYLMIDLTHDFSNIFTRIFMFAFTAFVIYFPPRLFYLAEHVSQGRVWLLMLLANSPILLRIVFAR